MYTTIRRYTLKNLTDPKDALARFKQRVEQKFVPTLQEIPGFHCYYLLTANDRDLVTVSVFEDQVGAQESTRRAAEFVRTDPLKDQMSVPDIVEGDLLVSKEALIGAH